MLSRVRISYQRKDFILLRFLYRLLTEHMENLANLKELVHSLFGIKPVYIIEQVHIRQRETIMDTPVVNTVLQNDADNRNIDKKDKYSIISSDLFDKPYK